MNLEEAYLEHILLHLRSNDPDDRPLRTYLDSWYAHFIGPQLMERRKPRPQWLNRGDLERRPELATHCHAISTDAEGCIAKGNLSALVKDHVIPLSRLVSALKDRKWSCKDELRTFLLGRYRVAVVTQDEHRRLNRGDAARRRAGKQLDNNDGVYSRYDCPEHGISYRILKPER